MRVLLTRAADDAARTRATLESLGHRVLVSPVISIEATGVDWPGGVIESVLATSSQAFVAVADSWGPTPEARRLIPLWLVGQRTQQAAQARSFDGQTHVAPNAVSLAFEISKQRDHGRMIYLTGRDRKPDIETALHVMDQPIEVVEVYDARASDHLDHGVVAAFEARAIDAVLHFSRRSAQLFGDLVAGLDIDARTIHICLSEDVSIPLRHVERTILIASEPTEASLIAALTPA